MTGPHPQVEDLQQVMQVGCQACHMVSLQPASICKHIALLQVQGHAVSSSRWLREHTHSGRPLLPVRENWRVQPADGKMGEAVVKNCCSSPS